MWTLVESRKQMMKIIAAGRDGSYLRDRLIKPAKFAVQKAIEPVIHENIGIIDIV